MAIKTAVLVPAGTVINKDTQTLMGSVIDCSFYDFITLHCEYQKGDETDCEVVFWTQRTAALDVAQDQTWTAAAGDKTATLNQHTLTNGVPHAITFDVSALNFVSLPRGGKPVMGLPQERLKQAIPLSKKRK